MGSQRNEETDMPLFRVEEVMLNYAEAMCELGEFDQSVADRTVNKLRSRANVAPMKVAEITTVSILNVIWVTLLIRVIML